jgi:hypothetical protein
MTAGRPIQPMKMRGIAFILTAIPCWVFHFLWWRSVKSSGFASVVGSFEAPVPPLIQGISMFAFFGTLIGLLFLLFDLVRWMRTK